MAGLGSTHSTFTLEMTISGTEPSLDIDYANQPGANWFNPSFITKIIITSYSLFSSILNYY